MRKTPISLRVDADVLDWFKEKFPSGGYQSAMNSVLRDFVQREELEAFMAAYREGQIDSGRPITSEELIKERAAKIKRRR